MIPALALVPLLAGSADEHVNWLTVGMKVLAFAGMLIGGRYLLRPVFRFIASSGVREVFTAATLLLVLGSAPVYGGAGAVDGAGHLYCRRAAGGK